ncbi:hypothetical protein ACE41H_15190 [Paenibacillus enshidis]|uniref:Uncharacterized protein n=1 Tax=Paenibacillus enshidis TaxID=1458439 RepID=A0ABV5AV80_9BACL
MRTYDVLEINPNKIIITYCNHGIVRVTNIEIGRTYWVHPDNPLKLKHRGRNCVVTNFYRDKHGHAIDASVRFLDDNRKGRVDLNDLVADEPALTLKRLYEKYDNLQQYLPDNVPDLLFTKNELKYMGRVPNGDPVASVYYADQKRSFPLFDLQATRTTRKQKGFSLISKNETPEDIIKRRKCASGLK